MKALLVPYKVCDVSITYERRYVIYIHGVRERNRNTSKFGSPSGADDYKVRWSRIAPLRLGGPNYCATNSSRVSSTWIDPLTWR